MSCSYGIPRLATLLHKHRRRRLQVDDEIGRRRIELEAFGHLLIEAKLVGSRFSSANSRSFCNR